MAKPDLKGASFPKLRRKKGEQNHGTVTGPDFTTGFLVHIVNMNGKKVWEGTVGTNTGGDIWNATVSVTKDDDPPACKAESVKDVEKISVTVTNGAGEQSGPVVKDSDVVP